MEEGSAGAAGGAVEEGSGGAAGGAVEEGSGGAAGGAVEKGGGGAVEDTGHLDNGHYYLSFSIFLGAVYLWMDIYVFICIEMRNENVKPNVQCPNVQCIYRH